MWPTGDYMRFKYDILDHYGEFEEITFGILIADARQTDAREYIINYLADFDEKSGKLFDFFIPGCTNFENYNDEDVITLAKIRGIKYYFSESLFSDFCKGINKSLQIEYTFNPMLVLVSMQPGNLHTAQYIVIELDDLDGHGVKRSGLFFMKLFSAIKTSADMRDIKRSFSTTYLKGNLLDSIINVIAPEWFKEIKKTYHELHRFAIRTAK